ncbi:TPA: LLM class flavin-dependent oxidoreductase, partial [Pseudomonas aeruginosa]
MNPFKNHRGYSTMYQEGSLTLGLFFAIESYPGAIPEMDVAQQIRTAQLAEAHNFAALYFR